MKNKKKDFFDFFIELLDATSLENTRLTYPIRPIVIFCGGEKRDDFPTVTYEEIPTKTFASLRECLISLYNQYYQKYLLFIPEDLKNWQDGNVFKDLLEFEVAFSHLSTVVVIITETPGSLVELGIFSADKLNKDKLLIIANSDFSESPSFINRGVFEYIRNSNSQAVKFFPINSYKQNINGAENPIAIDGELAQEIFEETNLFIKEKLKRKSCNFDIKNKTHFFSFLVETIHMYRVVSTKEIYEAVEYLNLHLQENAFSDQDVKQFFMLMRELDFLKLKTIGSNRFFHLNDDISPIGRVRFSYKENKKYDKNRIMNEIKEFYEENRETDKISKLKLRIISEVYGDNTTTDDFF
ncbi:MAG TPA: hypothetical protein DDZ35_10700 [Halomonas sp.]|nr:hypothetical protein [Halomonas sp.]